MKNRLKALISLLAVLALMLVAAPNATALTVYCNDGVSPIGITTARTGPSQVQVTAHNNSGVYGTAYFYAEDNGANAHAAWNSHSIAGNSNLTLAWGTTAAHRYWITVVPSSGYYWYGPGGGSLGSCHSPVVYQG